MPFLLSEHVFMHGRTHAAYSGQDSCQPCIMCPLRALASRWKPTGALGLGAHHYGKVCKHMALNRDVQRFSLNVPPTCRIWLKCNEVLVRKGRWLRRSDSHYCLVIDCQAADATLRNISSLSKECHGIWLQMNEHTVWKIFSKSKQAVEHYKHWICIIMFFSHFIFSYIVYSGFGAWLLCFIIPAQRNLTQHGTVQYSLSSEAGKLAHK